MPWSKTNLPPAAKKLTEHQKEVFVAAANAALKSGKDEGVAIAIGLAAAKRKKESMNKSLTEALSELIEKYFGGSAQEVEQVEVTKSLDEEKRMALFVVLSPQEGDTTDDLHRDTYTEEEVEKACNNFNTHCNTANLFHQVETEEANIIQSFISPSSFTLDSGVEIKKGTWLQWWYFPETEVGELLWKSVKSGDINGVSIQAKATTEKLTDE